VSVSNFDVLIVGAGIVGAACAREVARGGLRVGILEASDHVGGGATAAGMGHIAVMDDSAAQFALTRYSQQLWQEMAEELPTEAEFTPCGSLWIAADEEELDEVKRKHRFYTDRGLDVEILDAQQLAEAEPNLRAGMVGALLMSSDSVCYPPCAAKYLIDQAMAADAALFLNKPVVRVEDGRVSAASGEVFSAGKVVLCSGVQSRKLIPEIEVAPRKGHLLITDRYSGFLRHQLIELGYLKSAHSMTSDSVAFNAQPRATGQILIGSSRQYGTEDPAIERSMLSKMLVRAIEYMPELQHHSAIRSWTGFRASTPDKLPLIGPCQGFNSILLATGHEGLGISTSLATGRLIAHQILGVDCAIPPEPYLPTRTFATHA
jgi:D-hydroxyproline dehydrogenase subunit beta